ncbi:SO_0444 family Cu/Zn efflux transporter [Shewanella sp. D64]|uniref:SO_0444 family Cu/Zn efflux transporter n=1 Tax=unclassified Shewanella TaxID=196818 RepID=UPI0022BA660D|nr:MULTISPECIES: SO_0444 family Cu/Zn efflux transporter [unclassified Shewanella]MEC4728386.1 SO_0444 family Cu/Zn efflux transporter [Shewanella sp. D64]MEC4740419.1 SO_0444 family Cu/Zn efflux transporter [Shewanella sp. E94]WBJ95065.1 SO_0444 family Cu/Zn efflux transporter [Shewanella sp. MTB7]
MLFTNFIDLFLDSAPWLLLGLFLAGMLKMFVPMAWMQKQLGGHGFKTVVKAAVIGAPLPLCSCGVIPAAVGLRRSGASKAATTSFLVSTPETGVDSVAVSYVLLGPFMAVVRPIAAVISAIVAGLLVGRDDSDEPAVKSGAIKSENQATASSASCCSNKETTKVQKAPEKTSSCCSSKANEEVMEQTPKASCCGSSKNEQVSLSHNHSNTESESCCESTQDIATELKGTSVISRIGKGLHFAATDLVRDTTVWLLVGLFFAALVQTYVPTDFMAKWGDGILAMLVMVVISVPMYICATASTPIAAGLLLAGVSPGAVLVFMLAGPATNIATLGVVVKEMGKRALFGYLGGVLGVALISGILVNYLVDTFGFEVMPQIGEQHNLLPSAIVYSSGVVLAILMLKVLFEKLPKNWWRRDCCS